MKVAILDLGLGNLLSIKRGLERAGSEVILATKNEDINLVDAIVIPGVGAFRNGISTLKKNFNNIFEKPILGICLGMQLLLDRSYEHGIFEGMGLVKGEVIKLPNIVKIPHMGWNDIIIVKDSQLLEGLKSGDYFYFVHSYYCKIMEDVTLALTEYGIKFPSIIEKKNIVGVQFHPEKSGKNGLIFLKNFLKWCRK
ncbi:MAG: imidazole glycerol phosphate synthase subunit HisH [Candidatus Methanomethylicaceae archaeon]|nr:imidazole glycerol phosphate synthase subunit HisH [Candidatus Verstraetearchaeota archaeon]